MRDLCSPLSLRDRLRDETKAAHEALDRQVSTFDLTRRAGIAGFLGMQWLALGTLLPLAGAAATAPMLRDLHARAECDLDRLEMRPEGSPPAPDAAPCTVALDYVLAGSRLGTAVLKKRWMSGTCRDLRAADAYFSAPSYIEAWRAFCAAAAQLDPAGAPADRAVADTRALFKHYSRCAALTGASAHV